MVDGEWKIYRARACLRSNIVALYFLLFTLLILDINTQQYDITLNINDNSEDFGSPIDLVIPELYRLPESSECILTILLSGNVYIKELLIDYCIDFFVSIMFVFVLVVQLY